MEMAFLFALDWVEKDRSRYFAAAAASAPSPSWPTLSVVFGFSTVDRSVMFAPLN